MWKLKGITNFLQVLLVPVEVETYEGVASVWHHEVPNTVQRDDLTSFRFSGEKDASSVDVGGA